MSEKSYRSLYICTTAFCNTQVWLWSMAISKHQNYTNFEVLSPAVLVYFLGPNYANIIN